MAFTVNTKDIFTELINIGVGRAASSLSELLNRPIELTVPEVFILNQEQMEVYLTERLGKYVNVIQKIHGELTGSGILSFPMVNGKTFVDHLLGQSVRDEESFGTAEMEAIQEIGNIIINAVGSVISDMTGYKISYEVPNVEFREQIIPLDNTVSEEQKMYVFSSTLFKIQNIGVTGTIHLILTYQI